MQHRTLVDQLNIVDTNTESGGKERTLIVRLRNETLDAEGNITGFTYHRTPLSSRDFNQRLSFVNAHTQRLGWGQLDPTDCDKILALTGDVFTPEVEARTASDRPSVIGRSLWQRLLGILSQH